MTEEKKESEKKADNLPASPEAKDVFEFLSSPEAIAITQKAVNEGYDGRAKIRVPYAFETLEDLVQSEIKDMEIANLKTENTGDRVKIYDNDKLLKDVQYYYCNWCSKYVIRSGLTSLCTTSYNTLGPLSGSRGKKWKCANCGDMQYSEKVCSLTG